ncbi:Uncharacterised protein [Mycobacteroides abscessus subsp. abscessus]|nr:Uncharacterised protein [Mycobacteroides abscessus subsp. abscessus]
MPTLSTMRAKMASRHCDNENSAIWEVKPDESSPESVSVSVDSPLGLRDSSVLGSAPPMCPPSSALLPLPLVVVFLPVLRAMEFTCASKRSSWARRALSTCQTTLKRRLSDSACDGLISAGTATGKMM